MLGPTHRAFGALCGAAVAAETGQHWSLVAMTSIVATATSYGWDPPTLTSPSCG